jgi:2-polyprenyl-3-methyl-5-hydroxy-6-metoxy-1,4-benzoquinol methylase
MIGHEYSCPICSSEMIFSALLHDDRYGYPGEFRLNHCPICNNRMLDVKMTSGQLTDLYTNYYPRSDLDVAKWAPPTEKSRLCRWWLGLNSSAYRWVPPDVRVLDIGCGFGQSLGYHRARGCDAHGVEADENIRRVAEQYGLNVRVGLFDADNYDPDSFDYVTLDQVIEHVSDPVTFLKGVNRVLKHGGITIISTPNAQGWGRRLFGKKWIHWHAPYHQQFFSMKSMLIAAKKAGFELVDVKTITNSEWLHYQWMHLATYPAPGKPSAFWSAGARAGGMRRALMKSLNVVHYLKVNHLVTRLFDLIGAGDNRIYILRKP